MIMIPGRDRPARSLSLVLAIALAVTGMSVHAQDLAALREIEVDLLANRFGDYEETATREQVAARELRGVLDRLNALIGDREAEVATLRRLEAEVSLAREAAYLRARETTDLRIELYGRMERIEALDRALGIGDSLSGVWTLNLGPDDGAGTVTFRSYGERVEGRYEMTDGHRGTLLGTLVDGRLELERIDNVQGRDRRLVARVSQNETRISGTWQTFELASGRPTQGSWEARKREL